MHFVFGEFEFSVADVFVGEEFDFLEADDLGADEDVAMGVIVSWIGCTILAIAFVVWMWKRLRRPSAPAV